MAELDQTIMFDQIKSSMQSKLKSKVSASIKPYHEMFTGNKLYDKAVGDLSKVDWTNASTKDISSVARTIASSASKLGIEGGKELIESSVIAALATLGYTMGGVATGGLGIVVALGLEYGWQQLEKNIWPEPDELYRAGDVVIVNTQKISPSEARRRRMPSSEDKSPIDVAIALDSSTSDGKINVLHLESQIQTQEDIHNIAKVPKETLSKMEKSMPALRRLEQVTKNLADHSQPSPPGHTTKVGDIVMYSGEKYRITNNYADKRKLRIRNVRDGQLIEPMYGEVADAWNMSNDELSAGDVIWVPVRDDYDEFGRFELAVVTRCKTYEILIFYAYDGTRTTVDLQDCSKDGEKFLADIKRRYPDFITGCFDGDESEVEKYRLGDSHSTLCFTMNRKAALDVPAPPADTEYGGFRSDSEKSYNVETQREYYQDGLMDETYGYNYSYDPYDREDRAGEESGGNSSVFALLGAAAIGFVILSR